MPGESRAAAPPPVTGRSAEAPAATALLLLARSGRGAGAWGKAAPTACRPAPCRGTRRVASVRRQLAVDPPAAGGRSTAGGDPAGHPAAARAPGRLADPTAGKYRYPLSHGSTPRTAGYIQASERLAGGLAGGSAEDAQWIARQLSLITAPVNPPMPAPAPAAAASNVWFIREAIQRCWSLFRCRMAPRWRPCGCWRSIVSRYFSSACGWSSRLAMW